MQKAGNYTEFTQGAYDQLIFADFPQITDELQQILLHHKDRFVERLFRFCNNIKTLKFWFEVYKLKMTVWPLALAAMMGCNITVIRYLKEHDYFKSLDEESKNLILIISKRFEGEGRDFLEKELEMLNSFI